MKINFVLFLFINLLVNYIYGIDDGNILLPLTGTSIELTYSNNKIGNKHFYTTPINVGTPRNIFNVQVDTSVSTSWLSSNKCVNCVGTKNVYDDKKSSTSISYNKKVKLEDEDGNVEGYITSDEIELGGYTLQNFSFIQVTEVEEDFRDHYEGKLGLGYRGEIGQNFNLIDKLKKDGLILKKIFSVNEMTAKSGMLYIGDLPAKNYSFCNITSGEDLDDIYKESWVCELTHVGIFNINDGIKNKLDNYTTISDGRVNFDTAYDYIAVPISDRQIIEDLLIKAKINCDFSEKNYNEVNKDPLINKYKEEEIKIFCTTNPNELTQKSLALSFVLQGYVYSLPLESLFTYSEEGDKMEMLIRYINDKDAIWTLGYPFMNQFLMIFNAEDNHVGLKKLKKTALPIVNIKIEWNIWYDTYHNFFYKKFNVTLIVITAIVLFVILAIIVTFLVVRAIKRKNASNMVNFNQEYNPNEFY